MVARWLAIVSRQNPSWMPSGRAGVASGEKRIGEPGPSTIGSPPAARHSREYSPRMSPGIAHLRPNGMPRHRIDLAPIDLPEPITP